MQWLKAMIPQDIVFCKKLAEALLAVLRAGAFGAAIDWLSSEEG